MRIERLREMPPWRKLALVGEMHTAQYAPWHWPGCGSDTLTSRPVGASDAWTISSWVRSWPHAPTVPRERQTSAHGANLSHNGRHRCPQHPQRAVCYWRLPGQRPARLIRATMGADLVADLSAVQVGPLALALGDAFYADVDTMRHAVQHNRPFNMIHLETAFKVDVFVARPRLFDRSQLARRQLHLVSEKPEYQAYVATAEDIILAILEWYRSGGEVSDRQWHDVLGVIKVQAERLDGHYLRRMAVELDVEDMLERALEEAGQL